MRFSAQSPIALLIDKNLSRISRKLFRLQMKLTGNGRPTSSPYLSGDSFRALADHIFDETGEFAPDTVSCGDIVFVSNPLMKRYLKEVHPKINQPYILIEHNGDYSVDEEIVDLLDEKIVRFYAQNVAHAHEKIVPIPLGLENLHYHVNGIPSQYSRLRRELEMNPPKRRDRIFFRFSINTNPEERIPAHASFILNPLMETVSAFLTSRMHARLLQTYKFVASPRGNSIESSRTWEALYMGTIPIVKDYPAMLSFAELGLPLWIVRDWSELNGLQEKDLRDTYERLMSQANFDPLFMEYWEGRLRSDQEWVRISCKK